jgi:hypothetical protein
MIIWLASYPKSGNTWVRNIVNQIVYNDFKDKENVFDNLSRIREYPAKKDIENLPKIPPNGKHTESQKKEVIDHTVKNWKLSQEKINKDKNMNLFKTHNMLCKINLDNQSYPFTDKANSAGVIHIVRDPRNVLTSFKNHYSHDTQEETTDMMLNEFSWIGFKNHDIPQLISSWKNHYNSWKKFPENNLLIKYENLIKDPKKEIFRLIEYLSKFFRLNVSMKEVDKIIDNTTFENFSEQESKGKFNENVRSDLGEEKKFFYLGPKNNWKKHLTKETIIKITSAFEKEMKELKYL